MITPALYYFTSSALSIDLNVNTGSDGFQTSETCSVSVAAGAAVKIANLLTTRAGRNLNIGYDAQLGYRKFIFTGYNTVFGYALVGGNKVYRYTDAKIRAYIRLDASDNGTNGELIFLPYEVDYDGIILLEDGEELVQYPDIALATDEEGQLITPYALANTDANNTSGLAFYYIHIGTINIPEAGTRSWLNVIQSGQLETAKGNNEKESDLLEKMFKLVNNIIVPQKPFDKIWFSTSDNFINRIVTAADTMNNWVSNTAVATVDFINKYFLRKDVDDTANGKITFNPGESKGAEFGDYTGDTPFDGGGRVFTDENNASHAVFDYLTVRRAAHFTNVTIDEVRHVGGEIVLSAGYCLALGVEEVKSGNTVTGYKVYYKEKDADGKKCYDPFEVGDQARCHAAYADNNTLDVRYYWRVVTAVGSDNGKPYIILSNQKNDPRWGDGVEGNDADAPAVGDNIVLFGSRSGIVGRDTAQVLSTINGNTYVQYKGITSFTITDDNIESRIEHDNNLFTGRVTMMTGSKIGDTVIDSLPRDVIDANSKAESALNQLDNLLTGNNLLKNTGFRGQYTSREMENLALNPDTEMWSPSMEGWEYTYASAIDDQGNVSASGKLCQLSSGSIRQTLMFPVASGKDMVFSFKGRGTSVTLSIGGYTETISLSNAYETKTIRFKTSSTASAFELTGTAVICELYLSEGSVAPSTWEPSPFDNPQAFAEMLTLEYLKSAIHQGSTTVLGGLILSNLIELGNYVNKQMREVTAGISGIYNNDEDVAFWGGGTMAQAIKTVKLFKNNPSYKPTEEEWQNLAHAIITHGGDVIMKGTIFAENGFFRGKIEAEEGYLKNMNLTGALNMSSTFGYKMEPREDTNLSALRYTTNVNGTERNLIEYGLMNYSSVTEKYIPYIDVGDAYDPSQDGGVTSIYNSSICIMKGDGFVSITPTGFIFAKSTGGSRAHVVLEFENDNGVVKPHLYVKNSDESENRRIF